MPSPKPLAARRSQSPPVERLEQVVERLRQLADELPPAMGWVEAEIEALRAEVHHTLKTIAERAATDREELSRQVVLVRESVDAMAEALAALRDEVVALADRPPAGLVQSQRPGSRQGVPGGSGLGLPPRRSRA